MAKNLANTYSEALKEASLEQKVCCFTETPLEHCWMMVEDIEHRDCEFKPYGIVFSKDFGMKQGLNPVWYLNTTPRTDHLTVPINHMVESCREELDTGRRLRCDGASIGMSLRVFDLKSCGRHRLWNRSEPLPSEGRTFHGNENGEKLEVLNLIPEMWSLSWRRKIGMASCVKKSKARTKNGSAVRFHCSTRSGGLNGWC